MLIHTPVSVGEVIDKLTILQIKSERIDDSDKLVNICKEQSLLAEILEKDVLPSNELAALTNQLKQINEQLWEVEDRLRELERQQDFGQAFITDARAVYFTNDKRSRIKRKINELVGSDIVEEKSYRPY